MKNLINYIFLFCLIFISCNKVFDPISIEYDKFPKIVFQIVGEGIYISHPDESPNKIIEFGYSPEYSPVKNEIVYYGSPNGLSLNLYDIDTKLTKLLTYIIEPNQSGQAVEDVQWSPDGKKITYSNKKEGNFNIYIFDIEDSTEIKLTTSGINFAPQWSPDGLSIAYFEWNSKSIILVNNDGSNSRVLNLNIDGLPGFPFWLPDGRLITTIGKDSSTYHLIDLIIINQDFTNIDYITANHRTYFGCIYNEESVIMYQKYNDILKLEMLNINTYAKTNFININDMAFSFKVSPDLKWLSYKVSHDSFPSSNLCLYDIENKTKKVIAKEVWAKYSWSGIYD